MTEETKVQQFERLTKEEGIISISRIYSSPSQEKLFRFFLAIIKDEKKKQEENNIGTSTIRIRFGTKKQKATVETRRKPTKGIKTSKYKPTSKINNRMKKVIKILKNRKKIGLNITTISIITGTSKDTAYRAIRELKQEELITTDNKNKEQKQWILTTKGQTIKVK